MINSTAVPTQPLTGDSFHVSEKKETVGAAAVKLLKEGDQKQSVIETQREMLKGYFDELIKAAKKGEQDFGREKPFYVCVQTRRERLLANVIRNQFYARQTRPSPQYDLALYYYDPTTEDLRFVWCIPDKESVQYLIENELAIPSDQAQLVGFCKSFVAGTLI